MLSLFSLSNITLLVALTLSAVAAYYSIVGLTTIFAGAVIPIIIMGSILEIGKITTTVWLHRYWSRAGLVIKMYLVPAVVLLAFLTSMGIFGFLSKAHSDQSLVSGDVQSKIAVYDEKIKTARENIDANRKVLKQMDEAVDAVLSRSTTETGADRAVTIRKSQQRERARIASEIAAEQKAISRLSEERAPIAAEVRKVEAEVGPIKYIAALIYGDNSDANLLEAAVRWMIILIVVVFDPLAISLVLAASASRKWDKEDTEKVLEPSIKVDLPIEIEVPNTIEEVKTETITEEKPKEIKMSVDPHPVGWMYSTVNQVKEKIKKTRKKNIVKEPELPIENLTVSEVAKLIDELIDEVKTLERAEGGYVSYDGRHMSEHVLRSLYPDLFNGPDSSTSGFGTSFPIIASSGEFFVKVDQIPNKLFKFNGKKWIEIDKLTTETYLGNENYVNFLIAKIASGEYDIELMTDAEQDAIQNQINNQKS
jgi:hypothetical protein